jgi:hypothetical protein
MKIAQNLYSRERTLFGTKHGEFQAKDLSKTMEILMASNYVGNIRITTEEKKCKKIV